MAINASATPDYPYVSVNIESDDYGTSRITVHRSQTDSVQVAQLTIAGRTAGDLFDADNAVYKEAVGIVAAAGGEAKLLYYINSVESERVSLADILSTETNLNTFRALLQHDTIYNAAMAKRQKDAELAAEKTAHYGIYYRCAAQDADAVSTDAVSANTYTAMKAKVTGTGTDGLGLSESEVDAYAAFVADTSNATKKPILEKYGVAFSFDAGADATGTTDDVYSARATLILSSAALENLEVCLPITVNA